MFSFFVWFKSNACRVIIASEFRCWTVVFTLCTLYNDTNNALMFLVKLIMLYPCSWRITSSTSGPLSVTTVTSNTWRHQNILICALSWWRRKSTKWVEANFTIGQLANISAVSFIIWRRSTVMIAEQCVPILYHHNYSKIVTKRE